MARNNGDPKPDIKVLATKVDYHEKLIWWTIGTVVAIVAGLLAYAFRD